MNCDYSSLKKSIKNFLKPGVFEFHYFKKIYSKLSQRNTIIESLKVVTKVVTNL